MWLDRLGHPGAGTPQNNISRSGSPLPRSRGGPYVTSQRVARASTQSLISSDSSTSLLTYSRRTNGSSLRQSVTVDATEDRAKDAAALALLGKLLGTGPESGGGKGLAAGFTTDGGKGSAEFSSAVAEVASSAATITDEDLELDFDFGGLSLRQIVWNGPGGLEGDDVARSTQTPEDLETERAKLEDLHTSIRACDEVLNSVETNLTNFRNDLALVSADIENLQARSTALNVRLDNRKTVEKGLAAAVEDLSVPPALVNKIAEGNMDEQWVHGLKEVDRRAALLRSGGEQQKQSRAVQDLLPLLDKLVLKAVERIRDFLVAQIKALRSPHINAQIIQQQSFLKFRDLYTFLHKHHATLADEICLAYMNTMRWYYSNQFGRYGKSLEKLRLHVLDKNDVLGHDDLYHGSSRKGGLGGGGGGGAAGVRHDAFSLGRRIDLLKGPSQLAMSSYLAEEDTAAHYMEVPFRHFNLALVDNATAEYTFLASFFSPALSFATIGRHFHYIFEPTFGLGQALTRALTADSHDCLGVLLCIRLNQHAAFELQRRKVPAVDGYVNATNMLLWPRFQVIMDRHCESMRQLAAAVAASSSSSSSSSSSASSAASTASTAPHVLTQRFGQLLHGILALSTEAGDDEPVVTSLHRLRSEFEAFLTRYSQAVFGKDRRKVERFLYNNYSLVLTIIGDVNGGKLAAEQMQHMDSLKAAFQEGA